MAAQREYLGTLNLRSLKPLKNESIKVYYRLALICSNGQLVGKDGTSSLDVAEFKKYTFYGNTLLREFTGNERSAKTERVIRFKDFIFIDANLVYSTMDKKYTLSKDKGELIIKPK